MARKRTDFSVQVLQHLGVLGYGTKGWSKQVNIVSWNGEQATLDIRSWSYDQTHQGKGISLKRDEAIRLRDTLNAMNLGDVEPLPYPPSPQEGVSDGELDGELDFDSLN